MLTIIENDQRFLLTQIFSQYLKRVAWLLANPDGRKDGLGNQIRIRERCQLNEPDAVMELIQQIRRDLQRKPCLAGPAGPYECDEMMPLQFMFDFGDFIFTPNKGGQLYGKIVPVCFERFQGQERGREAGRVELIQMLGTQ